MLLDSWFGYLRGIYMFIKVFLLKYIPLCILCKKSRKEFFFKYFTIEEFHDLRNTSKLRLEYEQK